MNKIFFLNIVVFFLFLSSCKEKEVINNDKLIDFSKSLKSKDSVLLSTIATNVDYIKLESNSNCLIGRLKYPNKNVQFYENKIFIADESKVLVFDNEGQFLTQIGKRGKGPGEYLDIGSFTILAEKENIVIFSAPMKKVLFYNFFGKYIRSINIDFSPTALTSFNDHLLFVNSKGRRDFIDFYTLTVMSANGEIVKRLIYRENEEKISKTEKIGLDPFKDNFYTLNNTFNYWEYNYDTIWKFNNDFDIQSKYSIYYGENKLPFKYILSSNAHKQKEIVNYIKLWNYYESKRYLFFKLGNKTKLNHIYYDKRTKLSYNLNFKSRCNNSRNFSFINDVDGGLPFWPDGYVEDNKVFKIIYGYEVKKHLEDCINQQGKYNHLLYNKLIEITSQTKMDDNPIIMIVTLKN